MWSEDVSELHAFAASIGLSRSWYQTPPRAQWRHYDLTAERRAKAVASGAVETDRYGAVEHVARTRGDLETLARIERLRNRNDDPSTSDRTDGDVAPCRDRPLP